MIRPFQLDDADEVVGVWQAACLVRPWNDPYEDIARKVEVGDGLFLVAEHDGKVIGTVMAGYDGHRGWIYYLAVRPPHQRGGWGSRLLAAAEQMLAERGCPKINLQVRTDNREAVGFYTAAGYTPDAVTSLGKRLVID